MAGKLTVGIDGMTCGHCKKTLEGGISEIDGVQSVIVELETKQAVIELTGEVDALSDQINDTIEELGYEVRAI